MTELSALGIKVTSDGVVKTTGELERFAKASNAARAAAKPINVKVGVAGLSKAAADIQKMDKAMASLGGSAASKAAASTKAASTSIASAGSAARQANAHVLAYRNSLDQASRAAWEKSMAAKAAANADTVAANRAWAASKAEEALANSSRRASVALKERAAASKVAATAATPRAGGGWGNQSNPANIAAQFQDIGVTAAMGMNPLMIGLQQGTQLSAALAGGIKNLGAAIKQVLSPTSLLTIALVSLAVVGLQNVDWIKLAQTALNGLADIMVDIAPYAVGAAAALALIYSPAIIAGIATLTKGFVGLAASMLACIPIPVLIVAGLTAIVAAAIHFRDELTQILGFDIVQSAQDGLNWIIGGFVGTYNGVVAAWDKLPAALGDIFYRAVNNAISALEQLANYTARVLFPIQALLGLSPDFTGSFGRLENPFAGAEAGFNGIVNGAIQAARKVDYISAGVAKVRDLAGSAANEFREWAKALGGGDVDSMGGRAATDAVVAGKVDEWAKLIDSADKQMRALQQAGAQIGVYGQALSRLRYEQELFNQAQDAGIKLTTAQTAELQRRASAMADQEHLNLVNQYNADFNKTVNDQIRLIEQERGEIGLTGAALYAYRFEQEQVNAALKAGLTFEQLNIDVIREKASVIGEALAVNDAMTDSIKRQNAQLEDARRITKGFFTDWIDSVREGGNIFKAFANSVIDSLNRIIDKMLDNAWEAAFANMNGGGGGGFLGGIVNGIAGLFGGGNKPSKAFQEAFKGFANGAAFANDNEVMRFAKGGAFTNSIVSQPTLFKYANGGAFGEMGEAGPEAIMPLKRGPDGSLGVEAHGGGNVNNKVTVENTYNIGGVMTPEAIIAAIRQGGEETMRAVQRQLPTIMQEYDRNGAVAA